MEINISEYKNLIETTEKKLHKISDSIANTPYGPGKWLRKEMLGHLIDSAANNHARFVTSQFSKNLIFTAYDDNGWVRVQNYKNESWSSLISLWSSYNYHVLHVIESIPKEVLIEPRKEHNLNIVCWKKHPADIPASVGYLINDYYGHLQHHLAQIFLNL